MTMYTHQPERSRSLTRRIRRGLHERIGHIYRALESLGLTCIDMHQMLLRPDGTNNLSNLERWLARNQASVLWRPAVTIDVSDALTGHLAYRSAGGWRCLLCPIWSEQPLRGRCLAPLAVSGPDVWHRLRQESRQVSRTLATGSGG